MSDNYGGGVSRVLDPKQASFLQVIWQQGKPPLDSELNLLQQLSTEWRQQIVLRGTPSGWLGNDTNPEEDFLTNSTWSNWFRFGRQRTGEKAAIQWAVVNGWLIPVTGTKTGTPPGSPDDVDTWNKVTLDPPPGNSGDFRIDFVFLEVWLARTPPYPATLNKPSASAIYRYGNVEGGYSFLPDSLQDPAIGFETTQRVQVQYRIRVVKGLIGLATYPDGFDPTVVKAQGAATSTTSYTFTNMRGELGDPGLWRAGDGTANALGTVDGYSYAIPLAVVFRRNSVAWSGDPSQNLNGGFNRNPTATDRTGITTFSTIPTVAANLGGSITNTTLTLVSAAGIPMPASPATPVLIQIGDELMTYASITGVTVSGLSRGSNGTRIEPHAAGATIKVISGRPDGLFSDQIAKTDILDLRHLVSSNGFDYHALLKANLDKLLKGQLRSNWKRSGSGPQGPFVFYQDKISATVAGVGITKLDAPDGVREIFSDAAIQQRIELIATPFSVSVTPPAEQPVGTTWSLALNVTTTRQATGNQWSSETSNGDGTGDRIKIPVAQFKNTVPGGDSDQVRLLNEILVSGTNGITGSSQLTDTAYDFVALGVHSGDSLVVYSGSAKGTYSITSVSTHSLGLASSIATANPVVYEIRQGSGSIIVRVDGSETPLPLHRYSVTPSNPGPTDDLIIEFKDPGSPFPLQGTLYITAHLQYGPGRGISRRPDSIHSIALTSPSADILVQPSGVPGSYLPLRTTWALLWSKYRTAEYKGLLPATSEAYADPGSKTVILTPFRRVSYPATPTGVRTIDGSTVNGSQGLMPLNKLDGVTTKWSTTDPLGLFSGSTDSDANRKNFYVTLPRHLMPGWGAVYAPITPTNGTLFHNGINFGLMSREGLNTSVDDPNHCKQYINYTSNVPLSYASFSTGNFSGVTTTPATYNSTFTYSGITHAGARFFTDQRGMDRQGIELPPFYGIARLWAVYEASDYKANGSAYNPTTRSASGSGATNLLRQNFGGPAFWIEIDDDGDSTFILNAEALDLTRSPTPISSFSSKHYVVEASVFGFDRGSFDSSQPFRLVLSRARSQANTGNRSTNTNVAIFGPVTVVPGPMAASDTALVSYSRTPYLGDAWGSQSNYVDSGYVPGSIQSAIAYQLSSSVLDYANLTRPNQKPLEVLASVGFITTLGTGRLSGDVVPPNAFDFRNVGYENPTAFPPTSSVSARPKTLVGALADNGSLPDVEVNPEYLGCSDRLPLGSLNRDKDFRGGRFRATGFSSAPLTYLNSEGVGSIVVSLAKTKTLEQDEVNIMPASVASGQPGEVIVHVDGEAGNYSLLTNFRTLRGGSAFTGSGSHPGGELFTAYDDLYGNGNHTKAVVGRAYLVRNSVTSVGSNEVSAGGELMMLIATTGYNINSNGSKGYVFVGTNGSGEGGSAVDLYRIEGHPLLVDNVRVDVNPNTIVLSNATPHP